MYVGAPVSAVLYKCKVTGTNIPYQYQDHAIYAFRLRTGALFFGDLVEPRKQQAFRGGVGGIAFHAIPALALEQFQEPVRFGRIREIGFIERVQNGFFAEDLFQIFIHRRDRGAGVENAYYAVAKIAFFLHIPHCFGHMSGKPLYRFHIFSYFNKSGLLA